MWQSLGFGPNYKAAFCQAVCPAGDDIIGPYMADKAAWRREIALPLIHKQEDIYVQSGTRAEKVARRKKNKRIRYIDYRVDVSSPANFMLGLKHRFDPARAQQVSTTVTFAFPDGSSQTASIANGDLRVHDVATETSDATLEVFGESYIRVLHPDVNPSASHASHFELAGDAAGLTNPITGAGIAAAVMSGRLAGEALVAYLSGESDAIDIYAEDLDDLFGASLARAVLRRKQLLEAGAPKGTLSKSALRGGWIAYEDYWRKDAA